MSGTSIESTDPNFLTNFQQATRTLQTTDTIDLLNQHNDSIQLIPSAEQPFGSPTLKKPSAVLWFGEKNCDVKPLVDVRVYHVVNDSNINAAMRQQIGVTTIIPKKEVQSNLIDQQQMAIGYPNQHVTNISNRLINVTETTRELVIDRRSAKWKTVFEDEVTSLLWTTLKDAVKNN